MNTKMLLSALATAVVSFLLGWVIFGMMGMMEYYSAHSTPEWNALWKPETEMNMLGMAISNLAWGLLVAWSLWKMGVNSAMGGLVPGVIIAVLVAITMDMFFYSMMNAYSDTTIIVVDLLINAATGAVLGAVAGLVLGMGPKKAA